MKNVDGLLPLELKISKTMTKKMMTTVDVIVMRSIWLWTLMNHCLSLSFENVQVMIEIENVMKK